MNANIKRSKFEATEVNILIEIQNYIGLMMQDEKLPTPFRNELGVIWHLLDKMLQARKDAPRKFDSKLIKTQNGIEEWPESTRERWEALK